jgi:hypothetical protein
MQQRLEHTDDPIVLQFEARDATLSDQRGSGQCDKLTSIDRTGQQLSLLRQATLVGRGQFVAEQREIFESTPHTEVTRVIRAGFVAQDPIAVLITAAVLLGEGRLVIPAQHRMSGVALIQHGLQLAAVVAIDASAEQMRRSIGAAHQHAQLTGALEQSSEWR